MPLITTVPAAIGLLFGLLGLIFATGASPHPFWQRFYRIVPGLVLCCFLPAGLNSSGLIAPGLGAQVYAFSATYLLPASLFLLTLVMDLRGLLRLGWKVLALFLAGSLGTVLGGLGSFAFFHWLAPDWLAGDQIWRGLGTLAASWIGGAANMAALKELYAVPDELFGALLLIDATLASLWLFVILALVRHAPRVDRWLRADTRALDALRETVAARASAARIPTLAELMTLFGLTFAVVGLSNGLGGELAARFARWDWAREYSLNSAFFWQVLTVTAAGLLLSLTPLRRLEAVGAGQWGTLLIYVLVAAIGLQIRLTGLLDQWRLLLVAALWLLIHIAIVLATAKLLRAPLFFLCVGSNANTGGASSAAIVATAFHPALAPVGVLLGILGYALGSVGGYFTAELLRAMSGN